MNWLIEFVGGGIVVPAAVAFAAFLLVRVILSRNAGQRYCVAAGFAAAYVVGYLLLPSWAKLDPDRHWHWTLYLVLIAAAVGPVAAASGLLIMERWLLTMLVAVVSAWLLVPAWPNLEPPRPVWVSFLATYFFSLAALLGPLGSRISARTYLGALAISSVCVFVLIAVYVSITHGRLAGIAAAGLTGCWAACFVFWQRNAVGVGLAYTVIVGGLAFVGCVEPRQPYIGLLVAPCAPVALWCGVLPMMRRLHAPTSTMLQIALVLAALGFAIMTVIVAGSSTPE